jgi:cytoskeletal protein RodZ
MSSIGDILRKERENQGRTVAEIAEELCILHGYVLAMESGETNSLPGFFFYKSFARQYAAILDIDENLILPQITALAAADEAATPRPAIRPYDPLVRSASRFQMTDVSLGWSVAGLVCVLLVCSGFYAWWNREAVPANARLIQAAAAPHSLPPAAPVAAAAEPAPAEPAVAEATQRETEPPVTLAKASDEPVNGVVLKLSATEKTWLSISSRGHQIFSGVLQPSESKTLTGMDIATLKVGNAAGIDVDWNGKPIGPLGTRGQVLTIRFTPEAFEIVPPKQDL